MDSSQRVDFPLLVVRVLMACTLQIRRETFPFLAILKSPSNFLSRHNTEVSLSLFVDLINLGLEKGGQTWDNLNQNAAGKALLSKLCVFYLYHNYLQHFR